MPAIEPKKMSRMRAAANQAENSLFGGHFLQ